MHCGADTLVRDGQQHNSTQADDWRDVAIEANVEEVHPEQFLLTQKAYLDRLCDIHLNGLTLANMLVIMRTWSQGAAVHIIRHVDVKKVWTQTVDNQLQSTLGWLLEVVLDESQRAQVSSMDTMKSFSCDNKDCGLGLGSAGMRRVAAYLGAREGA